MFNKTAIMDYSKRNVVTIKGDKTCEQILKEAEAQHPNEHDKQTAYVLRYTNIVTIPKQDPNTPNITGAW